MPKAKRGQWSNDHFPPGMKAVLMIVNRQVKIIEYPPEGNEVFPRIVYTINPLSNGGVALTSLTEEELDAWVKIFNMAVDMARPIVQQLDAEAEAARLRNDTRYRRLWRAKPQFIDLTKENHHDNGSKNQGIPSRPGVEGNVGEHAEGVPSRLDGSDDVPVQSDGGVV
jgi:hypothetical protein